MTRPSDSSVARAFWEACEEVGDGYIDELYVVSLAEQFDAESPADVHTVPEKVTTSIRRVYIEPESERGYCPKCTGNVWVGHHCNGPHCPLRK